MTRFPHSSFAPLNQKKKKCKKHRQLESSGPVLSDPHCRVKRLGALPGVVAIGRMRLLSEPSERNTNHFIVLNCGSFRSVTSYEARAEHTGEDAPGALKVRSCAFTPATRSLFRDASEPARRSALHRTGVTLGCLADTTFLRDVQSCPKRLSPGIKILPVYVPRVVCLSSLTVPHTNRKMRGGH